MKVNRALIVIAVVLIAAAIYEVKLKPQSRPLYERALNLYRQEKYAASQLELERAYQIEPNSTAILVLRGWNHLKLRQYNDARDNFGRAARLDPKLVEPQLGLAYVALETGKGDAPLVGVRALLEKDPGNRDFKLATAVALRQAGQNLQAAETFHDLEGAGAYGGVARRNLLEMYGLEGSQESIPRGFQPVQRPAVLGMHFQARGQYLQRNNGGAWENFFVKGVNLGPATPGRFFSDAPNSVDVYLKWLEQIAELGANTVRVSTIMPPAFYRALKRHNEASSSKLYLAQQVRLISVDKENLFATGLAEDARREISNAIDLIHGRGDVPTRRGQAGGIYAVDVSPWVLGLIIGREFEPHVVLANNELNSFRKSHQGKFINLENGNPTEVFLAGLLDHAASYELEKYNHQRPLAVMNWAPLDPLSHPTEAGLAEELKFRRRIGERTGGLPEVYDDDDAVSVDETRFRPGSEFKAGLFAAYPVFPYLPDFLVNDGALLAARDHVGPNSFFGYLKALKAHYAAMPLLIVEYGIPSSIGVARQHPAGWNMGGVNERDQGELLARMTRNIADAGCAGGAVFEWQDEWSKTNWSVAAFEIPEERRALWLNALNPRENGGLWTYEPSLSRLFSADSGAWRAVKPLYEKSVSNPAYPLSDGADPQRTLRSLSVASDEAFVYLRLVVESLPRGPDGLPLFNAANYMIGISTRPGHFGGRILPALVPHIRAPEGFNFVLHVGGEGGKARLLIANNYNPYATVPVEGVSSRNHIELRKNFNPRLEDWTPLEEMTVETNRLRFGKDGAMFPARRENRSMLRYGPLDSNSPQYDSLATWSADFAGNSLIFRIPWGLLYVTDPSSRHVYAGSGPGMPLLIQGTEGMAFFAVSFRPGEPAPTLNKFPAGSRPLTDSLPKAESDGALAGIQKYRWEAWDKVRVDGHLRASARVLQKSFRELKVK